MVLGSGDLVSRLMTGLSGRLMYVMNRKDPSSTVALGPSLAVSHH